jgi:hypothetical protein
MASGLLHEDVVTDLSVRVTVNQRTPRFACFFVGACRFDELSQRRIRQQGESVRLTMQQITLWRDEHAATAQYEMDRIARHLGAS